MLRNDFSTHLRSDLVATLTDLWRKIDNLDYFSQNVNWFSHIGWKEELTCKCTISLIFKSFIRYWGTFTLIQQHKILIELVLNLLINILVAKLESFLTIEKFCCFNNRENRIIYLQRLRFGRYWREKLSEFSYENNFFPYEIRKEKRRRE